MHVASVNRMTEAVVKMEVGPFGNHVVGPGFPVDITPFAGEGKYVTLESTELTTSEYDSCQQVDQVVTVAGFPNAVREFLLGKVNRKVLVRFLLTPNDDEAGMYEIPDYGLITGEGYAFDLKAWDGSNYALFAKVEVQAQQGPASAVSFLFGEKEVKIIKIMD